MEHKPPIHIGSMSVDIPQFVKNIIERLHRSGFEAFAVGGAIRDFCLHRPIMDWDVTTSATPKEIQTVFNDLRSFSLKQKTVTIVHTGSHCEVTTFRGNRKQAASLLEDLGHRDFTINAMAYDIKTEAIIDPFDGMGDIQKKMVRAVGKPEDRFHEDPIRLLRAVRIANDLGFHIEQSTLDTISLMADQLTKAAMERIRDELMKILLSRRPSKGFRLMSQTGLLRQFLPEILEGRRKKQNAYHQYTIYRHIMETMDQVESEPLMRLTALFHDIAKPRVRQSINHTFRFYGHEEASARLTYEIMRRLRFSNDMVKDVMHLIENHMIGYDSKWTDGAVRRFIQRVGVENAANLISFRKADLIAHGTLDHKMDLLEELETRINDITRTPYIKDRIDLAVNGDDVMKILGLRPGPAVGKVLKTLMERVTESPEYNNKDVLVAMIQEMVNYT